jgi:hypothetical protein
VTFNFDLVPCLIDASEFCQGKLHIYFIYSVSSAPSGTSSSLNFCQLEESINKWTLELEEQEKLFMNQATQVNAWDRLLISNGEKVNTSHAKCKLTFDSCCSN